MKKKTVFLLGIFLFTGGLFVLPSNLRAQELNKRIFSSGANQEILIGYGNREGMEQEPFSRWFDVGYSTYQLNDSLINLIKKMPLSNIYVTIVLGTWCPDSRREVPRFFKDADALKIPDDHIKIIYVDRDKTAPDIDLALLHIERVPTFIFYRHKNELGRIVENPVTSLEGDMKKILTKK